MKMRNVDSSNEGQTVDITVYEYFAKHCGIELTISAYLPCLDVGKPKRPNYLPLEVCRFFCFAEPCFGSYLISIVLTCFNCLTLLTNYILLLFSFSFPSGGVVMFTCFPPTVYKGIISNAKSIIGRKITAKASR